MLIYTYIYIYIVSQALVVVVPRPIQVRKAEPKVANPKELTDAVYRMRQRFDRKFSVEPEMDAQVQALHLEF